MAEKIQFYADTGKSQPSMKPYALVYGPPQHSQAPLRSSDGLTLLTDKSSIMHHWAEHYEDLFGDKHLVQEDALASIPQQIVMLQPPMTHQQRKKFKAIAKLKRGKASGIDVLPAEVFMTEGDAAAGQLSCLFALCWDKGVMLQDLQDAVIVSL